MMDELLKNRTLYHFYQICQIPHGSHNEQALSTKLFHWAQELGLDVHQDESWNLVIKKPASPDRVGSAPVILQAHLDMVCDKAPEANFDFEREPIAWAVEGDWISSVAGTTLGADCGIGVALILAMLEADDYSHPPIEAVLTTREEMDMGGAYHLDFSRLSGRRMINLDISPEDKLLAGSSGGAAIELDLPIQRMSAVPDGDWFRITVGGLEGGHSGHDISKGRNNALLLLGRLLRKLEGSFDQLALAAFNGGNSRLAIPREAEMVVCLPEGMSCSVQDTLEAFREEVALECSAIPNFFLTCQPEQKGEQAPMEKESLHRFSDLLCLVPNGIYAMNALVPGAVESSCNLGIISTQEDNIHLVTEMRGNYRSTRQCILDQYETLARLLGGSVRTHSLYHSWLYQPDSHLREQVLWVYRQREQSEMKVEVAHAGNEIGIFFEAIPGLDAVAMGPTRVLYHTPKEKLSISSSIRFESFLKQVLEQLT